MNDLQHATLEYLTMGLDPVPAFTNKAPLYALDSFRSTNNTLKEFEKPDRFIGLRHGASSNTFSIDCDKLKLWNNYLPGFKTFINEDKTMLSLAPRGGHGCFRYAKIMKTSKPKIIPGLDIIGQAVDGMRNYTVEPPSKGYIQVHKPEKLRMLTDNEFMNLSDIIGIDLNDFLIPDNELKNFRVDNIPLNIYASLRDGTTGDRSLNEYNIVLYMLTIGWSLNRIEEFFDRHASLDSQYSKFRQKQEQGEPGWFYGVYHSAKEWRANNQDEIDHAIDALSEQNIDTGIRTSRTDQKVYDSFLQIMTRCHELEIGAGGLEIGEIAGINKDTAMRAINRLKVNGYLTKTENHTSYDPAKYTLNLKRTNSMNTNTSSPRVKVFIELGKKYQNHDLFRYYGLGVSGLSVWSFLMGSNEYLKIDKIIIGSGVSKKTVIKKLDKMIELNMIEFKLVKGKPKRFTRYKIIKNVDLNECAKQIGTFGAGTKQKMNHIRQRKAFRAGIKIYYDEKGNEKKSKLLSRQIVNHKQLQEVHYVIRKRD